MKRISLFREKKEGGEEDREGKGSGKGWGRIPDGGNEPTSLSSGQYKAPPNAGIIEDTESDVAVTSNKGGLARTGGFRSLIDDADEVAHLKRSGSGSHADQPMEINHCWPGTRSVCACRLADRAIGGVVNLVEGRPNG